MKVKLHILHISNILKFLHIVLMGSCLVASGLLAGCNGGGSATRTLENKQASLIAEGNPPAYIEGYLDGCASGKRAAGNKAFAYKRNEDRYRKDPVYARGWQDGQICCRNEEIVAIQCEQERQAARSYGNIDEERRRRVEAESRRADVEAAEIWEELKK